MFFLLFILIRKLYELFDSIIIIDAVIMTKDSNKLTRLLLKRFK